MAEIIDIELGTPPKISMKDTGHTKKIGPMLGIDCQSTTKMIINERIIGLFRTMEVGENIKIIIIRGNIGTEISIVEIGLIVEIDCKAITENLKTRDM